MRGRRRGRAKQEKKTSAPIHVSVPRSAFPNSSAPASSKPAAHAFSIQLYRNMRDGEREVRGHDRRGTTSAFGRTWMPFTSGMSPLPLNSTLRQSRTR